MSTSSPTGDLRLAEAFGARWLAESRSSAGTRPPRERNDQRARQSRGETKPAGYAFRL